MALDIKVGPPRLTVHQGYTVMVSDPDGQVPDVDQNGLYFLDTRLICVWTIFADGVPWTLLNGGAVTGDAARVYCTNADISTANGKIPKETMGLAFGRHIDGACMKTSKSPTMGLTRSSSISNWLFAATSPISSR
jgi:hypothetical protein